MSESTSTVLKVFAALVSPKAATQYICAAVALVLFWGLINQKLADIGAPSEHISLVALLLSAGIGSLVGAVIYFFANAAYGYVSKHFLEKALKKKESVAAAERVESKRKADEKFIENFQKAFSHFYYWTKEELRQLLAGERCLDALDKSVVELFKADYIQKVVSVSNGRAVYAINPLIRDYVEKYWKEKIASDTLEFFKDLNYQKKRAIEIMQLRDEVFKGPIEKEFIEKLSALTPFFMKQGEDAEGFTLCLYDPYYTVLSERLGLEFFDETYISYSWVDNAAEKGS